MILCSGVLCFAIEPSTRHPFFLLGKDVGTREWKHVKNRWSGFSGAVERNETVEFAAAREFFEETLGVVSIEHVGRRTNEREYIKNIEQMLRERRYFVKIETPISFRLQDGKVLRGTKTCFVIQIAWQRKLSTYFDCRRESELNRAYPEKKFLEKKKMYWFSLKHLELMLFHGSYVYSKKNTQLRKSFTPIVMLIVEIFDDFISKSLKNIDLNKNKIGWIQHRGKIG